MGLFADLFRLATMSMRKRKIFIIFGLFIIGAGLLFSAAQNVAAQELEKKGHTGLPLPRFVSLGSDEVNMRVGPGLKYPISWVLEREGLPVEIIREFDVWREIRLPDEERGWVHQSLLSGQRTAMVERYVRLIYADPQIDARPLAEIEPGVLVNVTSCKNKWCEVRVLNYSGWMEKTALWGVYTYDNFD